MHKVIQIGDFAAERLKRAADCWLKQVHENALAFGECLVEMHEHEESAEFAVILRENFGLTGAEGEAIVRHMSASPPEEASTHISAILITAFKRGLEESDV